jgi:hypothetical protein
MYSRVPTKFPKLTTTAASAVDPPAAELHVTAVSEVQLAEEHTRISIAAETVGFDDPKLTPCKVISVLPVSGRFSACV